MGKNDDVMPEDYPYQWSPKSQTTLQEFLTKYKPSMVQDDGTKPWLWTAKSEDRSGDSGMLAAVEEATAYLADVTERVEKIQVHLVTITRLWPQLGVLLVRANKKKGLRSKKEMREEVQSEATQKLKEISTKHGFLVGKWLIFAQPDKVDMIWSSVATSLVSGPLSTTSAYLAKVATSPKNDTPNYSHLICVYMPDALDQAKVTEVMKVLLRHHGLNLMGVKTDLYTHIGLDSKHPSGVSSTVWKNTALMKDTEIKALKEEYFKELEAAKSAAAAEKKTATAGDGATAAPAKAKPKLKKKAGADDPFASEDEGEQKEKEGEKEKKAKVVEGKKPASKKPPSTAVRDEAEEEARKAELKKLKAGAAKKRKGSESDEEEEEVAPKRKRGPFVNGGERHRLSKALVSMEEEVNPDVHLGKSFEYTLIGLPGSPPLRICAITCTSEAQKWTAPTKEHGGDSKTVKEILPWEIGCAGRDERKEGHTLVSK
ncbi:uncharacterized protein BXZ73DRAFT_74511 [Epithele typhae]|uniref:uncharacterized protein n=1 Tax=Epithele typhae TaxID=378194 RepID=UPI0020084711|nr:uncharacterized protein BXZ73DRAFT_74511 [Epithele typhae]KAH9942214.1 hypothetical protein BXZ73DRAFT_74511 [Epithele typhae]